MLEVVSRASGSQHGYSWQISKLNDGSIFACWMRNGDKKLFEKDFLTFRSAYEEMSSLGDVERKAAAIKAVFNLGSNFRFEVKEGATDYQIYYDQN